MIGELDPLDRFEAKIRKIFKPDDGQDIVRWLENNIKQIPFSPMPSGFNASETPWLIEPLRAIANDKIRLVQIIAPIQSGKSLMAELVSCYILSRIPAPTLYVHDTDDNADNWIQTRLRVLWENCPPVIDRIGLPAIKKKGNTITFEGTTFWCVGAWNEKNLQGRSIRWLVGDETWLWPKGHIQEALARVTSFGWLGKAVFMSQGSVMGDETHELWQTTSMAEWSFSCPCCGHKQPWSYNQIRIPEHAKGPDGEWDYGVIRKEVTYECEGCKNQFKDNSASRRSMNANGFYMTQNLRASEENHGYHWNALCARNWGKIVEQKLRADVIKEATTDTTNLRIWKQKQLAEFWTDEPDEYDITQVMGQFKQGDSWESELLIDPKTRRLHLDQTIKDSIHCRFCTVDVQRNGFWVVVRMWGQDMESRLHRWRFIPSVNHVLPWEDLKSFIKACNVIPALVFLDCGDQYEDVIRMCGANGWTALRGDKADDFVWNVKTNQGIKKVAKTYKPARLVNVGTGVVRVHHFSNLGLKDQLSRLRKMGRHMVPVDVSDEYLEQMDSEVRVLGENGKPIWKKVSQKRANHLFDCEVMQLVPAMAFGVLGIQSKPVGPQTDMDSDGETSDE